MIKRYLEFIKESHEYDVYDANNYVDDYLTNDEYEIYEEDLENNPSLINKILSDIQKEVDYVKNLEYPIKVYRGLPLGKKQDYPFFEEDYGCWSTNKNIATGFGDIIYTGLIENEKDVDIEQTIRTRILNSGEKEINVHDSHSVKIINIEHKDEL